MARAAGKSPDGLALSRRLRGLIVVGSLLLAPLVVWARPIVDLVLGSSYHGSITTLRVMSLCVYLGGLLPLVSVSVNYLGDGRRRVPLTIGATLLNALIDVILIPRIGIVSGAIATAVAYAVMVTGHLRICARHVEIPLAQIALTGARGLLAAAAMAVVLLLIGTDPSRPMLFVGSAAGAVVFLLALGLTREISRSEVRSAWATVRGRLLGHAAAS
jgi:O-antigen/teichoic acid export membrane protein